MDAPRRIACFAAALLIPCLAEAAAVPGGAAEGRTALEAARAAYRQAVPFRETLDLVIELPDGRREPKKLEYGVGKKGEAFLTLSSNGKEAIRIATRDGRMVGIQINAPGRYAETPYQGDFAAALLRMGGGPAQLSAPPAVAAVQGAGLGAFLTALRLGALAPLEIAGFQPAASGSTLVKVELRAANGTMTVGIDPKSHLPREISAALGEGKQQVRVTGHLTLAAGDPGAALAFPDLAGRTAVATLQDLDSAGYPLGQPAPKVTLRSLDGATVSTADLRGSVVVLDFWATWCVPCWTALGHTAELAAWARESGLPVKVFAVDTQEETRDPEEQHRRAAEFLRAKKLDLPVLLDPGSAAFSAFHNPGLPSLVILGKDGRLAGHYSGLMNEMVPTVRGEILELLKALP